MDPRPWIALNNVLGVGKVLYKRLITRFGGPEEVFGTTEDELLTVDGIRPPVAKAIKAADGRGWADEETARAESRGVRIVTFGDKEYPEHLRQVHDPPPYLYVNGALRPDDKVAVAIVGSRLATTYGRHMTRRIARELASKGITVVSGGARGIDTEAHRGALSAKGRTVAVLGCGIDVTYPLENEELFGLIAESGAVVSEYPMGTPPEHMNFPPRNRIISGMSMGVVVVEATGDSGSLITASYSLEQGREVYAVPGNVVSPNSHGVNSLIKRGAKLVEGAQDVLTDLFPHLKGYLNDLVPAGLAAPAFEMAPDERALFDCISLDPQHVDVLATQSGVNISRVLTLLLGLEMKGAVRQIGGMRYVREL